MHSKIDGCLLHVGMESQQKGYLDELSILKTDCFCRKPNPGLFFEQAFFRNINLKESLMIGDSNNDLYAAKNAGCSFLNVNDL